MYWELADTRNPHLHGLFLFQDGKPFRLVKHESKILSAWERAVKGGTIDLQEVHEPVGLVRYITKECQPEKSYEQHDDIVEVLRRGAWARGQLTFKAPIVTPVEALPTAWFAAVEPLQQGLGRHSTSRIGQGLLL